MERSHCEKTNKPLYVFMHIPKCAGGTIASHIESCFDSSKRFNPHAYRHDIIKGLSEENRKYLYSKWINNIYFMKRKWVADYLTNFSEIQRKSLKCIYGHLAYYGIHYSLKRKPRYITFLREPVSRFISYYNYILNIRVNPERLKNNQILQDDGKVLSIDEWFEKADLQRYSMTRFLSYLYNSENLIDLEYYFNENILYELKKMLDSFYFVGLTESEDDKNFIYGRFGIFKYIPDKNVLRNKQIYSQPVDYKKIRQIVMEKCPYEHELYEHAIDLNRKMKSILPNYSIATNYARYRRYLSKSIQSYCSVLSRCFLHH